MGEKRVSENDLLRYRRLAFYSEDVDRLNTELDAFVKKSQARCVLLIDKDGHLVAKQGFLQDLDGTSLAALVAGSFASTREVAKQLGESQFDVLFHQGQTQGIHIRLVGDRTLQVAVFEASAKPGLIQVLTKELSAKVAVVLDEIAEREEKPTTEERPSIDENFSSEMKDHLDDLFGGL